ncbi:hypothetical protein N7470_009079 [Penicillium chermesinum]|nr:hypothetical protein N7470_009079 [Penicillium chermesinum]
MEPKCRTGVTPRRSTPQLLPKKNRQRPHELLSNHVCKPSTLLAWGYEAFKAFGSNSLIIIRPSAEFTTKKP